MSSSCNLLKYFLEPTTYTFAEQQQRGPARLRQIFTNHNHFLVSEYLDLEWRIKTRIPRRRMLASPWTRAKASVTHRHRATRYDPIDPELQDGAVCGIDMSKTLTRCAAPRCSTRSPPCSDGCRGPGRLDRSSRSPVCGAQRRPT